VSTAVLSIGSNVGDRLANLALAAETLRPWLIASSPVYKTRPWGPVPQADYLNAVLVATDDEATPRDWLSRAHAAERAGGRVRDLRWGPRTLDVDVIAVDGVVSDDPELTLPHPRAAERAFVLVPWLAVDRDAVLAGRPVRELLDVLPAEDVAAVRRLDNPIPS
jgi:2-amino-4-hydroxy-6-hydroxymethyldihydropteridine diphosphokinase